MTAYYAVGDIHGCYYTLRELYDTKIIPNIRIYNDDDWKIIFVGDYIDRGKYSKQVVEWLRTLDPDKHVFLRGNHEGLLLGDYDYNSWIYNGGQITIDSFGGEIPEDYMHWFESLKYHYETEDYYFVHAGVMPEVPLDKQSNSTKQWIREEFLSSFYKWEKFIVHGHTPTKEVQIRPNRVNIDTGCVFGGKLTAVRITKNQPMEFFQVQQNFQDI